MSLKSPTAPCKTPPRTPMASVSNDDNVSLDSISIDADKNFWNVKGYKVALKRCDDGSKLGESLKTCIAELAELEDNYGKSLKKWEEKWLKQINESSEYQSSKDTWIALLKIGSQIGSVHSEIGSNLKKTSSESIKRWLDEKYKKSFIHFKQTKEFEKEFDEAQKVWQKAMEKIKTAKKDYHDSLDRLRQAETVLKMKYSGADCNIVMKREAERKVDNAKKDIELLSKLYKDELEQVKLIEPRYKTDMEKVFENTQKFEEIRLRLFKQIFSNCLDVLSEQIKGSEIKQIFEDYTNQLEKCNHETDLAWWANSYGPGMPLVSPKFEEPN